MSRYQIAKETGSTHEAAVLFDAKTIVDEELENPRNALEPHELHTILANARQDISAIAILLSGISARQRRAERWMIVIALLLGALLIGNL